MARREKERGQTTAGREAVSRRKFMRQTVEAAVVSLFGVTAFEPVMERVLRRVAEMRGIDRLADQVAQDLRASGAAYAVHCE